MQTFTSRQQGPVRDYTSRGNRNVNASVTRPGGEDLESSADTEQDIPHLQQDGHVQDGTGTPTVKSDYLGPSLYKANADWYIGDKALAAESCSSLVRIVHRGATGDSHARLLVTRKEDDVVICDRRVDDSLSLVLAVQHPEETSDHRRNIALYAD
nr:hypothetical protein BaRGS_032736 [Batillaria attramentaria]